MWRFDRDFTMHLYWIAGFIEQQNLSIFNGESNRNTLARNSRLLINKVLQADGRFGRPQAVDEGTFVGKIFSIQLNVAALNLFAAQDDQTKLRKFRRVSQRVNKIAIDGRR